MLRALEFAARLDFSLDDSILAGIDAKKALIATAAPARIREEIMELYRHKVAGPVLKQCRELGMLPHLLAGYPGSDESIELLAKIDQRTAAGTPIEEGFAIAALYLRLFMNNCPPSPQVHITDILHKANEIIIPHCHYFSIAQGIRHEARELLVGCFRLARGRGIRGERRFLQHPLTPKSLELFRLWSEVRPDLLPLVKEWGSAIKAPDTPKPAKKRRPRRRRSRRAQPAPESN